MMDIAYSTLVCSKNHETNNTYLYDLPIYAYVGIVREGLLTSCALRASGFEVGD